MAAEYPRQHVWSGDPGCSITFLICLYSDGRDRDILPRWLLSRASTPVTAVAVAIGMILPLSDDWPELNISCRPLTPQEVDKVSLKDAETVELDDESLAHLVEPPNGEDHAEEEKDEEGGDEDTTS